MRTRARRLTVVGWVLAGLAALMVPWTAYLFVALPRTAPAAHYDLAWGGFDVGLLALLGLTGWAAVRRRRWLGAAAGAAAALLAADAWFDVVTSPTPDERWVALAMAVLVEVPLAVVCAWVAVSGQDLLDRRLVRAARLSGRGPSSQDVDPVRRTPG
ncbi:hypothetical protein SAMN04489867_1744 [Pedococcus dokdonensis]|uniref:LPXTG-motif cell wall anchor domain-containing protein n=1 Tax=Pedococcus dokdonensis TaxID=443156 RepID=A0A1H0QUY5_9MICO|nr:hypothetical protein [Pedococcus dokdonensis]SDP21122.1 hypothetical protein SAMN04489867_1744 [Pedococcus dokdonensis]